ncbi:ABC transporter, ATP-binding protein [Lentilactobacillus farraginis DSM 18382 = JCM 14108]|uniref:ABC transporter, ATP-binding protein n=1 Tax=Lentilactobacillus farraginis DSM 18382 = JCM 14108 TaxID=1423743 RepID=X0PHA7_9LACO|nr:ABC transporter, ATP-binding protein [Lentilactobacillus farraginis DSM 18382 = JCM 14108]
MAYIDVQNESKKYRMGDTEIIANDNISFQIESGSLTVILGPSGAGKSTVLNILGGMDSPTSGKILIDGTDIAQFNERQLTQYRRNDVGFIFQFYNLIPNLSTRENVELATSIIQDGLDPVRYLKKLALVIG